MQRENRSKSKSKRDECMQAFTLLHQSRSNGLVTRKNESRRKKKKGKKADTELLSIARLVLHLHCLGVSFICMRAEGGRERGREGGREGDREKDTEREKAKGYKQVNNKQQTKQKEKRRKHNSGRK